MVQYILIEDEDSNKYDYVVKSIEELDELCKSIHVPIFGVYKIMLQVNDKDRLKWCIYNANKYNHFSLFIKIPKGLYNSISLALPGSITLTNKPVLDYMKEGIAERNLVLKTNVLYALYNSIDRDYESVDEALDMLVREHGKFIDITMRDLAKHVNIIDITYPREVLVAYINMNNYRTAKLNKCLEQIDSDIIIAAMVKNIKALTKQKLEYLKTGIGSKFIQNLCTKNLMLMNYHLRFNKNYKFNDIVLILHNYEEGAI